MVCKFQSKNPIMINRIPKADILSFMFVIIILFVSFWFYLYNLAPEYKLYRIHQNKIDTNEYYIVAPKYYEFSVVNKDTIVYFFNEKKEFVVSIKKDSLINYKLIKK